MINTLHTMGRDTMGRDTMGRGAMRLDAMGRRDAADRFLQGRPVTFADQIEIDSDLAAEIADADAVSEARMENVKRLRSLIEAGEYLVSSNDLAERLISSMMCRGSRTIH